MYLFESVCDEVDIYIYICGFKLRRTWREVQEENENVCKRILEYGKAML